MFSEGKREKNTITNKKNNKASLLSHAYFKNYSQDVRTCKSFKKHLDKMKTQSNETNIPPQNKGQDNDVNNDDRAAAIDNFENKVIEYEAILRTVPSDKNSWEYIVNKWQNVREAISDPTFEKHLEKDHFLNAFVANIRNQLYENSLAFLKLRWYSPTDSLGNETWEEILSKDWLKDSNIFGDMTFDTQVESGDFYFDKSKINKPLFPHGEPRIEDIEQGDIGDCSFLAAITSILNADPEIIKNSLRDNNDGTVTVTFFKKSKPIKITVTKTIPKYSGILYRIFSWLPFFNTYVFSQGCLWVEMLRKAYVVFKSNYDTDDEFTKLNFKNDYKNIDGGSLRSAIKLFTGKEPICENINKDDRQLPNEARDIWTYGRISDDIKLKKHMRDESGKYIYNERQINLHNSLKKELENHNPLVCCFNLFANDGRQKRQKLREPIKKLLRLIFRFEFESTNKGLVENHAYSILGIREDISDGSHWIILRNPHAWYVRKYKFNSSKNKYSAYKAFFGDKENGTFEMELGDFYRHVAFICGFSKKAPGADILSEIDEIV